MSLFDDLQREHDQLIGKLEQFKDPIDLVDNSNVYIEKAIKESEHINDARERSQLRSNLRFWASKIYEQTGNFPDTSLRPPSTTLDRNPTGFISKNRTFIIVAGILGAITILTLICTVGYVISFPRNRSIRQTEVGQIQPQNTATALSLQQTDEDYKWTPTLPYTATPRATEAPDLTVEPDRRTATVAALLTQAAAVQQTVFPTSTSLTPLPDAGGGGSVAGMLAVLTVSQNLENCLENKLSLQIEVDKEYSPEEITPAEISISESGSGDIVGVDLLYFDGNTVSFILPINNRMISYLVQVDHPGLIFDSVIVQFLPDCKNNQFFIHYQAWIEFEALAESLKNTSVNHEQLMLSWFLETWGPAPREGNGWVAVLNLKAQGGDGHYVYWVFGYDKGEELLPDNRLVVYYPFDCGFYELEVGVTSGGLATSRWLSLISPMCVNLISTPTPTG